VERAIKQRHASEAAVDPPSDTSPLVGRSAAMHGVWKIIGRAAASHAPALVKGEPGTGKRLVARAIHDYSPRAQAVFSTLRVDRSTEPTQLRDALAGLDVGGTVFFEGAAELSWAAQTSLAAWLSESPAPRFVTHVQLAHGSTETPLLPELY